jgi:hypothetical protein
MEQTVDYTYPYDEQEGRQTQRGNALPRTTHLSGEQRSEITPPAEAQGMKAKDTEDLSDSHRPGLIQL